MTDGKEHGQPPGARSFQSRFSQVRTVSAPSIEIVRTWAVPPRAVGRYQGRRTSGTGPERTCCLRSRSRRAGRSRSQVPPPGGLRERVSDALSVAGVPHQDVPQLWWLRQGKMSVTDGIFALSTPIISASCPREVAPRRGRLRRDLPRRLKAVWWRMGPGPCARRHPPRRRRRPTRVLETPSVPECGLTTRERKRPRTQVVSPVCSALRSRVHDARGSVKRPGKDLIRHYPLSIGRGQVLSRSAEGGLSS